MRWSKSFFDLSIVTTLVIFLFSVLSVSATETQYSRVYYEDFESYASETYLPTTGSLDGWVSTPKLLNNTSLYSKIKEDPNNENSKGLYIYNNYTWNPIYVTRTFDNISPGLDGIVKVKFTYRDALGSGYQGSTINLMDGNNIISQLKIVDSSQKMSLCQPAVGGKPGDTVVNTQVFLPWTKLWSLEFVLNFNTKTVSLYANNTLLSADTIDRPFVQDCNSFNKIYLGSTTSRDQTYYDNFEIYTSKDAYEIYNVSCSDDGNQQMLVTANAGVKQDFQSVTLIAAAYDANGRMVMVDTKPYTKESLSEGAIAYQKTFNTNGQNIEKVKVFLWDSLSGIKSVCQGRECLKTTPTPTSTPSPTPTPTPTTFVDTSMNDVQIPTYMPADVVRANVPQEVSVPTPLPTGLDELVVKTYPEGKLKAVLMSFDDGGSGGYTTCDQWLVMPLLRQYKLKSAFNVNQKRYESNGVMVLDPNGNGFSTGSFTDTKYRDLMNNIYNNPEDGFEIACHTLNHKQEDFISKDTIRLEQGQSKNVFETLFNREIAGYVRPGSNDYEYIQTTAEWRAAYRKYVGYRYVRNAPFYNPNTATKSEQLNFDLPTNFLNWNPTVKLSQYFVDSNRNITPDGVMNAFINLEPNNNMKLLFGWGHAWEMGSFSWTTLRVSKNETYPYDQYTHFNEFCRLLSTNLNTIWNPTPIEFVDYVNATRQLVIAQDGQGNIFVSNPSPSIKVWLKIKGELVTVDPGMTIVK